MSLLSPVSLSQKAASVADTGGAHTHTHTHTHTQEEKDASNKTRSGGIDPGVLKGIRRHRCPLKHCKVVTGRLDASN